MLEEICRDSFKNFEIYKDLYGKVGKPCKLTGWQKLFFSYKCFELSAAVAIATFEIYE